jgi:hypothetical protein
LRAKREDIFVTRHLPPIDDEVAAIVGDDVEEPVAPVAAAKPAITTVVKGTTPMNLAPIFPTSASLATVPYSSAEIGGPSADPRENVGLCDAYKFAGQAFYDQKQYMSDPYYKSCWDQYAQSEAYRKMLRVTPDAVATPQTGTQPVGLTTGAIFAGVLDTLTKGWGEIEKGKMQIALLKAQRQGKPAYLTQQQAAQARQGVSTGWIIGGGAALILGGVLIYMLASKKNGKSAASTVPALAK